MDEGLDLIKNNSTNIFENIYDNRKVGEFVFFQEGVHFYLDFNYEHEGGLEGSYRDTYEGNIYLDNKAYWFRMEDVFCSGDNFEVEREITADLKEGDRGYINLNKQKETIMSNNMNVVTVILMDQDDKLKGTNLNIIGKFEDVVIPTGQDEMTTLLKLSLNGDVKKMLDEHNEKRTQVVNNQTLERTGKKVNLQPIVIEDVQILIK